MTQRMQAQYVQIYIDGSAAKQIQYVPQKQVETVKQPKPKAQKRIRIYVDPVAIFGVVVAVCMMITLVVGMVHLHTARQEVQQMEEYVIYLNHQNRTIKNQYAESYSLEEVEKTALALGMIPADQVTLQTIYLPEPVVEEEPTIWESVGTFLTGLFA